MIENKFHERCEASPGTASMTPELAAYIQVRIVRAVCERMLKEVSGTNMPQLESVWKATDQAVQILCASGLDPHMRAAYKREMELEDFERERAKAREGRK